MKVNLKEWEYGKNNKEIKSVLSDIFLEGKINVIVIMIIYLSLEEKEGYSGVPKIK